MTREETDALVEAIARRVVGLLDERPRPAQLITAGELAQLLSVSVATIYEHAGVLGARRLGEAGPGRRPRLRFEAAEALEAWTARSAGDRSSGAEPAKEAPSRPRRSRRSGTAASLLPVGPTTTRETNA